MESSFAGFGAEAFELIDDDALAFDFLRPTLPEKLIQPSADTLKVRHLVSHIPEPLFNQRLNAFASFTRIIRQLQKCFDVGEGETRFLSRLYESQAFE